ncbi:DUF7504 family protein [Halomarina oriensis]|uniref:Uncharacterized protein n=1 Tax=Halomarina oriensis TaxID=671145 RepID=A0A6B0GP17_9EURY|nr:hypothetical protein [Halomarina oriensis]MWG36544.1 hypothetical protein [Halomarina oriensis]
MTDSVPNSAPADDVAHPVEEALQSLHASGGRILVSGAVGEDVLCGLARKLFGDGPRPRVLATADLDAAAVDACLPSSVPDDQTAIVRHGDARGSAAMHCDGGVERPPPPSWLRAFRTDIYDGLAGVRDGVDPSPSEIRVGVLTLRPLLDDNSPDEVASFCRLIGSEVTLSRGVAFFGSGLPTPTATLEPIRDVVDAEVRLRWEPGLDTPEQRWVLQDGTTKSQWHPLDITTDG